MMSNDGLIIEYMDLSRIHLAVKHVLMRIGTRLQKRFFSIAYVRSRRTHQGGEKNTYVRERIGRGFRCTNGRGDKKQKWCDHNHVYQPIVKVGFTLSGLLYVSKT